MHLKLEYSCCFQSSRKSKKENRITQSDFVCVACGYSGDADITAAGNVLDEYLRAGHARLACGETGAVRSPGEAGTLKAA